tara:strand:- start:338 stop:505 length:168 start_codon:yes stop_codon:yes gene_type:complete
MTIDEKARDILFLTLGCIERNHEMLEKHLKIRRPQKRKLPCTADKDADPYTPRFQ